MTITTHGGTIFEVTDELVTIVAPGKSRIAIPIDDLEEFSERYFHNWSRQTRAITYPPPGYEPAEYEGELPEHHPTFKPWTLKSLANAVQPYWVMCPICGFRTPGSTMESAAQNWNNHILMSQPHA